MRPLLCIFALALFKPACLFAQRPTLVSDYMPQLNGKPWPRVPLVAYVENKSNVWVHPSDPKHFPAIREIAEEDTDFTTVVMNLPDGSILKTYNDQVLGPYLAAVYSGDFNGDGIPDFMAIKPGSGCGLAGEYCIGVFAFSDRETNHYRFTRLWAMGLGPHSLVRDPKTKAFRLIQTSFRQTETLDGRHHSFWLHRFYKLDSDSFHVDSSLSRIWIQYLNRPNHEPTKLLNEKLKATALLNREWFESRIDW